MEEKQRVPLTRRFGRHIRRSVIGGLLLLIPVVLTYMVLKLLFETIDGVLKPIFEGYFDTALPGLGAIVLLLLVYVAGLLSTNIVGRRLIAAGQSALLRTPIVGAVYSPARQLIESFSGAATTGFKRVVMIEHPRKGAWSIGFLTGLTTDESGRSLAIVYIPTAPTPNSGWVALLPIEDVYDTDLDIQSSMTLAGGPTARRPWRDACAKTPRRPHRRPISAPRPPSPARNSPP